MQNPDRVDSGTPDAWPPLLETSRTALVFTRQVCTPILAVIPPLLEK